MREECAGDDIDALAGDQLFGDAHGVTGVAAIVTRDHFQFLAEQAALGIDLFDRQFPALLVRVKEGRLRLVTVQFTNLDRILRRCGAGKADRK